MYFPPQPTNHPQHERALLALWLAVDALAVYLDQTEDDDPQHSEECAAGLDTHHHCPACRLDDQRHHAEGTLYAVELLASGMDSQTYHFAGSDFVHAVLVRKAEDDGRALACDLLRPSERTGAALARLRQLCPDQLWPNPSEQ